MVASVEAHECINQPVAEVFECLSAVENETKWPPSATELMQLDDELGVGTRWTESYDTPSGTTELNEMETFIGRGNVSGGGDGGEAPA